MVEVPVGVDEVCDGISAEFRLWHKADIDFALTMSAIGGKADIRERALVSANDPKRTFERLPL